MTVSDRLREMLFGNDIQEIQKLRERVDSIMEITEHENVSVLANPTGQWPVGWGFMGTFKREWHDSKLAALEWIEKVAQSPLGLGYRSFSIALSDEDMGRLRDGKTLAISGLDCHVTIEVEHDDQE